MGISTCKCLLATGNLNTVIALSPIRLRLCLPLLCWTLWGVSVIAEAKNPPAGTEANLNEIRSQLAAEKKRFASTQTSISETQAALKSIETNISRSGAEMRRIATKQKEVSKQLQKLTATSIELENAQNRHERGLANTIANQYLTRGDDRIRLWLNGGDPLSMGRLMSFHQYVSDSRRTQLVSTKQALRETIEVREQVSEKSNQLARLSEEHQRAQESLQKDRTRRDALLATLNQTAATTQQKLDQLKEDEQRLINLLEALAKQKSAPKPALTTKPKIVLPRSTRFADRKGALPWPVQGKVIQSFGSRHDGAGNKSRGVMIDAAHGDSVRAIAPGRVVFAEWLRGFGLLLIVDHGDRYFSLYGHNETLLKDVGDLVEENHEIATVGASGGMTTSGLYFEIRHQAKPVNPAQWCAG